MTTENILSPVAALTLPDSVALTTRAQRALAFIRDMQITSAEDYGLAADELKAIKTRANAIEEQRTGITVPINAALKAINNLFRGPADLLGEAEKLLKGKMLTWSDEQERIAAEARRKAQEAADAERRKLEDEAAARQAEAVAQAEVAAQAFAAGDAQAAAIATANAQRAQAEAQSAAETSQMVIAPVQVDPKTKAKGISTVKKIDFEVTNLYALVKHVAEKPELLNLLVADSVRLRAYVKGLGMACALPGVRVFEDRSISARAA